MGYSDPPEAYMLAMYEETIAGCGRIEDHGNFAMLRPLVVSEPYRGYNVGRLILQEIMPANKPTMLVARGEAIAFYKAMEFLPTGWDDMSPSQRAECNSCFNRNECMPQPMIHIPASYVAPHGVD